MDFVNVGGLKGYDLSKASRKLQMVGKIITSKRWRSVSDHTQFNALNSSEGRRESLASLKGVLGVQKYLPDKHNPSGSGNVWPPGSFANSPCPMASGQ